MNKLINFLKDFYKNDGLSVFVSFFLQKVSAFASTLIVVRLLTPEEFGLLSIVPAIFVIFSSFTGLGLPVALLRYGSLLQHEKDKRKFAKQILKKSISSQLLLTMIFMGTTIFFIEKYQYIFIIFISFGIRFFGSVFLLHLQVFHRILFENKQFARLTNYNSFIGLGSVALGTYFYGFYGYLVAMALAPYFVILFYKRNHFLEEDYSSYFSFKEVWNYARHAAFTNLGSELLFAMDILLLSSLLSETYVASYKVAILIPANMVFLVQSLVQSDYPKISSKNQDYHFLKNYIIQFYKIFVPICFVIVLLGYFFREDIICLFFGERYVGVSEMFVVFLFAFSVNMLFRVLFGNMLSAIGKMNFVTYITLFSVVVLVIFAFAWVPKYGMMGMAYSMFLALLFCGIAKAIMFMRELKKLK